MMQRKKNQPPLKELADRLKNARGTRSQNSLAIISGVSDRTISLMENINLENPQKGAPVMPRPESIARLAIATKSDPNEWLSLVGRELPSKDIERLKEEIEPRLLEEQKFPKELKDFRHPEIIKSETLQAVDRKYKSPDLLEKEIMDKVKEYIAKVGASAMSELELTAKVERRLIEYVDTKFAVFERRVRDVEVLVEQVDKWHRELLRELLLLRQSPSKQTGGQE